MRGVTDDQPFTVPIVPGDSPVSLAQVLPEPKRSRVGLVATVIAGTLGVLAVVALGAYLLTRQAAPHAQPAAVVTSSAPSPTAALVEPITVTGFLDLVDPDMHWKVGKPCEGDGGYADISVGAQVIISDSTGKTVALTGLIGGNGMRSDDFKSVVCSFGFISFTVPPGAGFYGIAIGHRDPLMYSESDLADDIHLSLGHD